MDNSGAKVVGFVPEVAKPQARRAAAARGRRDRARDPVPRLYSPSPPEAAAEAPAPVVGIESDVLAESVVDELADDEALP